MEDAWQLLRKLKIDLQYDPAFPFLRTCTEEVKAAFERVTHTPMFIAAQFTISEIWNKLRCPSHDDWIKCNGLLLSYKK